MFPAKAARPLRYETLGVVALCATLVTCTGAPRPSASFPTPRVLCEAAVSSADPGPPISLSPTEAPSVVVQAGHTFPVSSLIMSGDGSTAVTVANDGLRVWDMNSAMIARTVSPAQFVSPLGITDDGSWLFGTAERGSLVRLIDIATWRPLFEKRAAFTAVGMTRDGSRAVLATSDGKLEILELPSGKSLVSSSQGGQTVGSVQFSPDGGMVATATGAAVSVLDSATLQLRCSIAAPPTIIVNGAVLSITFSRDGHRLVTAINDDSFRVTDLTTCKPLREHTCKDFGETDLMASGLWEVRGIRSLGFVGHSATVMLLARGHTGDEHPVAWNTDTDAFDFAPPEGAKTMVQRWMLDAEGTHLGAVGWTGKVEILDPKTYAVQRVVEGKAGAIALHAVSHDGDRLMIARGGEKGDIVTLDTLRLSTGQVVSSVSLPQGVSGLGSTDAQQQVLAIAREDRGTDNPAEILMVDLATGSILRKIQGAARAGAVALSADGTRVAAAGYSSRLKRAVAAAWDARTGTPLFNSSSQQTTMGSGPDWTRNEPMLMTFSPDGKWLGLSTKSEVALLDSTTGMARHVFQLSGDSVGVCFAPDGRSLVAIGKTVLVWDIATGKEKAHFDLANGNGAKEPMFVSPGQTAGEVLVGGWFGHVWRIDVNSKTVNADRLVHTGMVYGLAARGDRLITASADRSLRVLTANLDREIATVAVGAGPNYALVLPDGRYSAPRGALSSVAFRVGHGAFSFDQFDLRLNRPDAVMQALGAPQRLVDNARALVSKRLARAGLDEAALQQPIALPFIQVQTAVPLATRERELSVDIRATAAKAPLDQIVAEVDDVPIVVPLLTRGCQAAQTKIRVALARGTNRVSVSVRDTAGNESLRKMFQVQCDAPGAQPELHVFAIGVSRYRDVRMNLEYAAKDARDLANLFRGGKGTFSRVHVRELTDEQANRANVLALRSELNKTREDDHVLVFVAGHGVLDRDLDYYFAPQDFDPKRPSATGISFSDLQGLFAGVPARRRLLLMDTCHAGEVDRVSGAMPALAPGLRATRDFRALELVPASAPVPGEDMPLLLAGMFADLRRDTGAHVIASSSGREYAMEASSWRNGVFTYALLNGLSTRAADLNHDGAIKLSELQEYVESMVGRLTVGQQHPTARRENLAVDFRVW